MLAHGVEESRARPRRDLSRLARLRCRGHGSGSGQEADRRTDGGGDRAWDELPAPMAQRRRRDVGQPRNDASRPAMAGARRAADDPHDHFGDRGGRRWQHAPAVIAGGRIALPANRSCRYCQQADTTGKKRAWLSPIVVAALHGFAVTAAAESAPETDADADA